MLFPPTIARSASPIRAERSQKQIIYSVQDDSERIQRKWIICRELKGEQWQLDRLQCFHELTDDTRKDHHQTR